MADKVNGEFERLLVESSTLAFRVAYGVLRQREDAEDVAQEAFIRRASQLSPAARIEPAFERGWFG